MYELAENNAKSAGESSRARRFNRGAKTLKDLIKQAKRGKQIEEDDIPPEVFTGSVKKPPAPSDGNETVASPTEPPASEDVPEKPSIAAKKDNSALLELLNERRNEYKIAALTAKKSGDKDTAMNYLKIFKQFEVVIKAAQEGQEIDVSKMPGPPAKIELAQGGPVTDEPPTVAETQNNPAASEESPEPVAEEPEEDLQLITASSVEEALEQRLEVYKKQEEAAKEQGNSSKARRMGRIVKQYEQAIKLNNAGKPVPFDELPTPPGYAPLPQPESAAQPTASKSSDDSVSEEAKDEEDESPKKPRPAQRQNTIRITGNQVPNSRSEKQLMILLAKQKEFKIAALKAKRNGETEQAKEYLRNAKRLDRLIDAASSGLPVDMTSLPISPTAKVQLDQE